MAKRLKCYGQGEPEDLDLTPVEMPLGGVRPKSLNEIVATMVKSAIEAEQGEEFETFEEADDFEPEDEDMMLLDMSKYTLQDVDEGIHEDPDPPRATEDSRQGDSEASPSREDLLARITALEAQLTGDSPDLNDPEPDKA